MANALNAAVAISRFSNNPAPAGSRGIDPSEWPTGREFTMTMQSSDQLNGSDTMDGHTPSWDNSEYAWNSCK